MPIKEAPLKIHKKLKNYDGDSLVWGNMPSDGLSRTVLSNTVDTSHKWLLNKN